MSSDEFSQLESDKVDRDGHMPCMHGVALSIQNEEQSFHSLLALANVLLYTNYAASYANGPIRIVDCQ